MPTTLTTIGTSAFSGCSQLRFAVVPGSVLSIGSSSFTNCSKLRYVLVTNSDCTIGTNAFANSPKMILYCDVDSLATVYAIDHKIPYTASDAENISHTGILDRTASNYFADANSINTNGHINFTIDCTIPESEWSSISGRNIVIKVPVNTELEESSIKINGELSTDFNYNENNGTVTIPLTKSVTNIKYSVKVISDGDILSYALFTYRESGKNKQEVIGVINEDLDTFTIYSTDLTSTKIITVEGAAPANSDVSIYADNMLVATAKSNKSGTYSKMVVLPGEENEEHVYIIKSECETESGDVFTASCMVTFRPEAPSLTGFKFYIDSDESKMVDLYSYATQGISPAITHTGSKHPYKFVITYTNPEAIDSVYVTSTRSNIKKSIPAVYDKNTGEFVAVGHFDEENKLYVPGALGVEYNLKHEKPLVGDNIAWDVLKENISPELINGAVVNSTATEKGSYGTIDLSGVSADLADVLIDYSVGVYDEFGPGGFGDLLDLAGVAEKVFAYTIPGVDNKKYHAVLDMRDPGAITMVVADAADVADTAVKLWISANEANDVLLDYDIYELSGTLSNFSTVAGVLSKAYGIHDDYDKLCDEIMQSSTISDKQGALAKAEELKSDQMAFMLITTMLPLLVAGGPMTAPALVFSAMLGVMTAASDVFWQLRVTEIKGKPYKIKWHIDPSGYVYDAITNERLQGVTATAYCVEYDESEDFWDNMPSANVYGTLWNSLEYNQSNPLITDAEGRYAWDVPEGWWRVKYEKAGYETVWSHWMPVPPVQTEVNIGMMPTKKPDKYITYNNSIKTVTVTSNVAYSNANVFIAAYQGGKLLTLKSQPKNIAIGETPVVFSDFDSTGADTVKVMVWESASNIKPLFNTCVVNLK